MNKYVVIKNVNNIYRIFAVVVRSIHKISKKYVCLTIRLCRNNFTGTIFYSLLFVTLLSCSSTPKVDIRYSGSALIYTAVAYVMELQSTTLVKADIINNEYISSYIKYTQFGRVNRFRLYMSLKNNIFETEIGDVQIQIRRRGFESWENDDVQSLIDTEVYTQNISKHITRAAGEALYVNFKQKLHSDLEFNRIVLKDLTDQRQALWVKENMFGKRYQFESKIERILKARNNREYGKYLIKMSRQNAALKSHIKLEYYTSDPSYTRYRIGDRIRISANLVSATYSKSDNILTIVLTE